MSQLRFNEAVEYALNQLKKLSPKLTYHCLWHTEGDVVPSVERLLDLENITGESRMLLLTAAYYHDIGFTQVRAGHEEVGVMIVSEVLPDFGYRQYQIEMISGLILATKLPQTPRTPLEEIMADADLDSLGREDFLDTSLALRDELAAYGVEIGEEDWYIRQRNFLQSHRYFRRTARNLRQEGKQENIDLLTHLIQEIQQVE